MNLVARLGAIVVGMLLVSSAVAAVAALLMRRRLVPLDDPEADEVRLVAIFEPIVFESWATRFQGGTLDCWFGGSLVDLRGAVLDPDGATLRIRTIFGGAQIIVPEGWRISAGVQAIFGGIGGPAPSVEPAPDAPELRIEGLALFGGLGVLFDLPEAEREAIAKAVERRRSGRDHSRTAPVGI